MSSHDLKKCIEDLEKHGELLRISEEVDPNLEMAAIHRRVYAKKGPAILFEKIKDCPFPAVSNLFGTKKRWEFIFRHQLSQVKKAVSIKANPEKFFKKARSDFFRHPLQYLKLGFTGLHSLPKKIPCRLAPITWKETTLDQLPQIVSWPKDGGAFITLPQVFSVDPNQKKIMHSNLGMYRIQLSGNHYAKNKEVGLHYQIHRGLGIHHQAALNLKQDLAVSIFIGGHPAHTLAAIMPLPEGMSELIFAGMLAGKRFRYCQKGEHYLSADADFCITGWIKGTQVKPEGPFGDHLGYYSLTHPFPVLQVDKVYHRPDAIWPFTIVGRPPQEDSSFGQLIHDISAPMVPTELPGIKDLHAVDESGVHPLLLAIGSERYVPYRKKETAEILTQAYAILGFNQCSLAKYLFITTNDDQPSLTCHHVSRFFHYILERVDWSSDLHFQTKTSIDTLDYSGEDLNKGSKLILTVCREKQRQLGEFLPKNLPIGSIFSSPKLVAAGIIALSGPTFQTHQQAKSTIDTLCESLVETNLDAFPLIIICDDSSFCATEFSNFLWLTFTRSNPSHDIYGIKSMTTHKHWGCQGSLIIDARIKPHHAPPLIEDPKISKQAERIVSHYLNDSSSL